MKLGFMLGYRIENLKEIKAEMKDSTSLFCTFGFHLSIAEADGSLPCPYLSNRTSLYATMKNLDTVSAWSCHLFLAAKNQMPFDSSHMN